MQNCRIKCYKITILEFLTHDEACHKFASKSKGNAALTLGIIGTGLAALNGNGCGNNGILGGIFGGNNGNCLAQRAMDMAILQGQQADNLSWSNRVQSMKDDADIFFTVNDRINRNVNDMYQGRIQDLQEKSNMYIDLISRDNANAMAITKEMATGREIDIKEKSDIYDRLVSKINDLEKREIATATALPLMFELASVKANKYTDDCCCKAEKDLLVTAGGLQRQLDHKINGHLKYSYSDLCAPVPDISPLYCSPFTPFGTGMYVGEAANAYNNAVTAFNKTACRNCITQ